jgi:hypothetical protein
VIFGAIPTRGTYPVAPSTKNLFHLDGGEENDGAAAFTQQGGAKAF